ncbi:MAG: hypothetical protein IGBAC_1876 [Ignavibacteriae bacterium]|nr:MAG: hypothetical protein IGBAC_1876 [Ignavibacteriota bacterium]
MGVLTNIPGLFPNLNIKPESLGRSLTLHTLIEDISTDFDLGGFKKAITGYNTAPIKAISDPPKIYLRKERLL